MTEPVHEQLRKALLEFFAEHQLPTWETLIVVGEEAYRLLQDTSYYEMGWRYSDNLARFMGVRMSKERHRPGGLAPTGCEIRGIQRRGLKHTFLLKVPEEKNTVPETILQEAERLTNGERRGDYGHPLDDFTRLGKVWGAMLGREPIPPETVGLMMAALKLNRELTKPKRDNRVDGAGYLNTVEMVHAERERREKAAPAKVADVMGAVQWRCTNPTCQGHSGADSVCVTGPQDPAQR